MASPEVLEIERLLSPIEGENPCGESIRFDPVWDEIKAARDDRDRRAVETDDEFGPNFALVLNKASEALATRTKDLNLAVYLTEAVTEIHGFAGLRDGLLLLKEMIERYWEFLYPLPDEDDYETRLAPLQSISQPDRGIKLPSRIRLAPIVPSPEGVSYSWQFWRDRTVSPQREDEDDGNYLERSQLAARRASDFDDAVTATPTEHFATLREDIAQCAENVNTLGNAIDLQFGTAGPSMGAIRDSLEDCRVLVDGILQDRGYFDQPQGGEGGDGESGGSEPGGGGPISSRQEALNKLREIAAFFRQTEPHSPMSYLIDRAANWGQLPFDRLLSELVKDESVKDQIGELLGLKSGDSEQ